MIGENLIAVINDVQDALSTLDIKSKIDLPQIAVVGSQSSGKSSVLESIVGRDFLPRGSGIVTRCPLVLKLTQRPAGTPEYGVFSHKPEVKFEDFEMIRTEIEERTAAVAGPTAITASAISLTIYSPRVLDLTLIDLPGLVSNAVGDQPRDIERQIRDMVMNFIKPENTIILAVSPANADIANSISLKVARIVDPDFHRTIGVLTKLDLMDEGTDASDVLEGRLFPLKRGWIGVVNRSQKAINEKRSMDDAKAAERDFFRGHPAYRGGAAQQGTEYLASQMSQLLLSHIQRCLPELRSRIEDLMKHTIAKQTELGMLDELNDPATKVLSLFNAFGDGIGRAIDGNAVPAAGASRNELVGGARIDYIFHEAFCKHVNSLRAGPKLTTDKLRNVIRNSSGIQSNLFPSDKAFLTIVKEQISRLEEPSLQCVNFVYEELRQLSKHCAVKLDRYPMMKERVVALCNATLDEFRTPCLAHVKTMLASEVQYINVRSPRMQTLIACHFGSAAGSMMPAADAGAGVSPEQSLHTQPGGPSPQRPGHATQAAQAAAAVVPAVMNMQQHQRQGQRFELPSAIQLTGDVTAQEATEHAALREMVEGYFTLCKDTVNDQIPKIVNHMLVQRMMAEITTRLMKNLFKESLFEDLLSESPQVANMRKATTKMMACLLKAQEALDRVRDVSA
jgi:dynamin 1-like protein